MVQLWKHQQYAIEFFDTHPSMALLFEAGTGKTLTQIRILEKIYTRNRKIVPTLVVCPIIVMEQWKKEILAHSDIPKSNICILSGTEKERIKLFQAAHHDSIFIANFEGIRMKQLRTALVRHNFDVLVVDEAHRMKNHSAETTKLLHNLSWSGNKRKNRFILTGTPIANLELDLWSQYYFLDKGDLLGDTFWSFRAKYFYDRNAGMPKQRYFPDWVARPDTKEKLRALINKISVLAKKSEVLDLPPLVRKSIPVHMSSEQNKAYQEMQKYLVTYLNDDPDSAATAQTALTKSLRLQQIVSGFVKQEDETEVVFDKNPRANALKEILSDVAPFQKVIVWAVFKRNYETIRKVCESLGLKYVELHGDIANKDKFENVKEFNENPEIRVLIGHPGSGGVGVNLTASSYCVWFSRSFSNLEFEQATARNYRGGSEVHESITHVDLVCPNTIDEVVIEALSKKQSIAQAVVRELKTQRSK